MNGLNKMFSGFLVIIIKLYQYMVSPWLMPACRFNPTCSQYGIEAISKYGGWKGGILTVKRIASCHPLGRHGHDPVP